MRLDCRPKLHSDPAEKFELQRLTEEELTRVSAGAVAAYKWKWAWVAVAVAGAVAGAVVLVVVVPAMERPYGAMDPYRGNRV